MISSALASEAETTPDTVGKEEGSEAKTFAPDFGAEIKLKSLSFTRFSGFSALERDASENKLVPNAIGVIKKKRLAKIKLFQNEKEDSFWLIDCSIMSRYVFLPMVRMT